MNTIFNTNKPTLQARYKVLQREESELEKVTRAKVPDEKQIFAAIDRVVVARGELEKANAHMLLEIRGAVSAEQIERRFTSTRNDAASVAYSRRHLIRYD